jgi:hypothetical protein
VNNPHKCSLCGEPLTNPRSIALGVGPVCARKLTAFTAAASGRAATIAMVEASDDPEEHRQLRLMRRAPCRQGGTASPSHSSLKHPAPL